MPVKLTETNQKDWTWRDVLILLIVMTAAFVSIIKLASALGDPWNTTIPEVSIIYSILGVAGSDHTLYRDFSQFPYTTTPYTPLFYIIAGIITKLCGGTVLAATLSGRIVSLCALAVCVRFVYLLAVKIGASSRHAFMAALLACGLPIVCPWAASCRPDILALMFSLWGVWALQTEKNGEFQPVVCATWVAAFFTKPSFITGPVVWILYLLLKREWKAALKWSCWFAVAVGLGLLLVQWASEGEFIANVVTGNMTHFSMQGLRSLMLSKVIPAGALIFLLGISGLVYCLMHPGLKASEHGTMRFLMLFAECSTLLFYASGLKAGSAENYFFEPLFVWAVFAAPFLGFLRQWMHSLPRSAVALVSVGLVAWVPLSYALQDWEHALRKPGRAELKRLIEHTPGEILFVSNGEGMNMGRGVTLHDGYNASYLEAEKVLSLAPFAERIAKREFGAVVTLMYDDYCGYTLLPPSLLEPLGRNYQTMATFPPYRWMKLRPHALALRHAEFPRIASAQTQIFRAREYTRKRIDYYELESQGVLMGSNGYLEKKFDIPASGAYQFDLYALSREFPGTWAKARISVGKAFAHEFTIDRTYMNRYSARGTLAQGRYSVRIEFTNDRFEPPFDLNLLVDRLEISPVAPAK